MGLIKTGLKAAVAVKTAHYVHDRIQQRQHGQWVANPPAGAPGSATAGPMQTPATSAPWAADQPAVTPGPMQMPDTLAMLTQLGELRTSGVLTEAEFQAQKARILHG
jgi:hypothetical protein